MNKRQRRTLEAIFATPTRANIKWHAVRSLLVAVGATVDESRAGSRVGIVIEDKAHVVHKPHPQPDCKKYLIEDIRELLISHGIVP